MNKSRENIASFEGPTEKLSGGLSSEKVTAGIEKKEEVTKVEKAYQFFREEYLKGKLSVSEIENYLEDFLKEKEIAQKENRPLSDEFGEEVVRAYARLLREIKEKKLILPRLKLTEEEINKLLIAAGFKEEYLKTMYEGKEILEEMIRDSLSEQKVEKIKEAEKRLGKTELSEEEIVQIEEELKIEAVRKFLASRELVIKGIWAPKRGKWGVKRRTNLDGKSSLGLLSLAGIDISKIKFVAPGEWEKGAINLDTGYRDGFVFQVDLAEGEKKAFTETTFFDHHGPKSDSNTSSAKSIYETLVEFKLLKKTPELDKLVEFVTQIDNLSYPNIEKYFETSDRTILGLQRFITFENLLKYIKTGRSFTEKLSDDDLKEYGFIYKDKKGDTVDRSKKQREIIEKSKERLKWMEENGFVIDTNYGKIVVDVGGELQGGQLATMAWGYSGYLSYNYKKGGEGFFLALNKGKLEDLDLLQGILVRNKMYLQPRGREALHVTLKDIIQKITSPDFKPTKKLKESLSKESADREKLIEEKKEDVVSKCKEILTKHPVYGRMSEEAKKKIAESWASKFLDLEKLAKMELTKEEFKKLWNKLLKKRKRFPKVETIDEFIARAKKELEIKKRETLIEKYEKILEKHPIHGEAPEEERRKVAERLADKELEGKI